MFTKKQVAKAIVTNVVAYTTGFTVSRILRANTPTIGSFENTAAAIGSMVIGYYVAGEMVEKAANSFDQTFGDPLKES